jgi:hypothetical protein
VISETKDGQFAMVGHVEARASATAQLDAAYLSAARAKVAHTAERHRAIVELERAPLDRGQGPATITVPLAPRAVDAAARAAAKKGERRERMPKGELVARVFELFASDPASPVWRLRRFQEETSQPVAWLKEVLGELCVQSKAGYELKPEFQSKQHQPPPVAAADDDDGDDDAME